MTTPAPASLYGPHFLPNPDLVTIERLEEVAPVTATFPLTELGNSKRLAHLFGDDIAFESDSGRWLCWDGHRWAPDTGAAISTMAATSAKLVTVEARTCQPDAITKHLAWAKTSESRKAIGAAVELAKLQQRPGPATPIITASSQFDADGKLLNCANGTVNLHDGTLRPHDRADLLRKMAPTDYRPSAASTVWKEFLDQALGDDQALIDYVQLLAGATLLGTTKHHLIPFVFGPPGSGKSTFLTALDHALGADYATTASIETFANVKVGGGPREDFARLEGARMVTASEAEHGQRLSVGLLKRISGGDLITARSLYAPSRTFIPQMTVWFAVNDLPVVPPDETGLWRRIIVIPFTNPAAHPDPDLSKRFTEAEHAQAILAWAVAGAVKLTAARRLPEPPDAVAEHTARYEGKSRATVYDPFDAWHAQCCSNKQPDALTSSGDLYASYREYCQREQVLAASQKLFSTRLAGSGYEPHRTSKMRGWVGVALKNLPGEAEPTPATE